MESQVHLLVMEVKGTLTDRPSEMEEGNSWWEGNPHAVTRSKRMGTGQAETINCSWRASGLGGKMICVGGPNLRCHKNIGCALSLSPVECGGEW